MLMANAYRQRKRKEICLKLKFNIEKGKTCVKFYLLRTIITWV